MQSLTSRIIPLVNEATTLVDVTNSLPLEVDVLADVQAASALLKSLEDRLKESLATSGQKEVCGLYHRAVITHTEASSRPDWKAIAQKLNPSVQLITAHKKEVAASTRVTLYGYTNKKVA